MTDLTPRKVLQFPQKQRKAEGGRLIPGKSAAWGRGMAKIAFQAIEYDDGLEAAIAEYRQIIAYYDKSEVAS